VYGEMEKGGMVVRKGEVLTAGMLATGDGLDVWRRWW